MRVIGLAVIVSLILAPLAAEGQQTAKVARIGYLSTNLVDNLSREAFLQGLRDLGHIEGRNVAIEYRDAEGKPERVAVLWQRGALGERTEKEVLKEVEVAARLLGVQLQFVEARQ